MVQLADIYDQLCQGLVKEKVLVINEMRDHKNDYLIIKSHIDVCKGLSISIRVLFWPSVDKNASEYLGYRYGSINFHVQYPDSPVLDVVVEAYQDLNVLPDRRLLDGLLQEDMEKLAIKIAHAVKMLDLLWHRAHDYAGQLEACRKTESQIYNSIRAIVSLPPTSETQ